METIVHGGAMWHTCQECSETFDLMTLPVQHGRIYCPHCCVPIGLVHIYKGEEDGDSEETSSDDSM